MDSSQRKELLLKLVEGTKMRKYNWKQASDTVYSLAFGNSSLVLVDQSKLMRDPSNFFLVQLYSNEGTIIEQISAGAFERAGVKDAPSILSSLSEMVKNQVLKIDETIEDIFKNL